MRGESKNRSEIGRERNRTKYQTLRKSVIIFSNAMRRSYIIKQMPVLPLDLFISIWETKHLIKSESEIQKNMGR